MSRWLQIWQEQSSSLGPRTTTPADARVVAERVIDELQLNPGARILDWGCGPAHGSELLAERGIEVLLFDRAHHFIQAASQHYASCERVHVLNESELRELPEHSMDAVLLCSVLQYLDDTEVNDVLQLASRLLKPSGALALIDVIPKAQRLGSELRDVLNSDVLAVAPSAAARNLLALSLSLGRRLRWGLHLRRFEASELIEVLDRHGLRGSPCAHNFKPSRSRQTWIAKPQ
ncbi:MAG: hypothetical protein CMP23_00920 [Rickettsiales bacterium]|nr:hypothetical protein [Rickettsiales bacterium]|tara:strand:+ start:1678 stop:2373 length:696 start_codon:yes stop_codon:yes gene_type:complete